MLNSGCDVECPADRFGQTERTVTINAVIVWRLVMMTLRRSRSRHSRTPVCQPASTSQSPFRSAMQLAPREPLESQVGVRVHQRIQQELFLWPGEPRLVHQRNVLGTLSHCHTLSRHDPKEEAGLSASHSWARLHLEREPTGG